MLAGNFGSRRGRGPTSVGRIACWHIPNALQSQRTGILGDIAAVVFCGYCQSVLPVGDGAPVKNSKDTSVELEKMPLSVYLQRNFGDSAAVILDCIITTPS